MFDDLFFYAGKLILNIAKFIGADDYYFKNWGDPKSVAYHWLRVIVIISIIERITSGSSKGKSE